MPKLDTVSLVLSNECNAECSHCLRSCTPDSRGKMDPALIENIVDQCRNREGMKGILLSGGEPFIDREMLDFAVKLIAAAGIYQKIDTNGFWATSSSATTDVMNEYEEIGRLHGSNIHINVSLDKYHQDYVPLEYIANICVAYFRGNFKNLFVTLDLFNGEADHELFSKMQALMKDEGMFSILFDRLTPENQNSPILYADTTPISVDDCQEARSRAQNGKFIIMDYTSTIYAAGRGKDLFRELCKQPSRIKACPLRTSKSSTSSMLVSEEGLFYPSSGEIFYPGRGAPMFDRNLDEIFDEVVECFGNLGFYIYTDRKEGVYWASVEKVDPC
jgi:organic radical activating enzyme